MQSNRLLSFFLIFLLLASVFVIFIPSVSASDTLYERYNAGNDGTSGISDTTWRSQTFTIGNTGTNINHLITSVKLLLYRVNNPGIVTVYIETVNVSNYPTNTILAIGTTDGDTLTPLVAGEWREIFFTTTYVLHANTRYAIVVKISGSGANSIRCLSDDTVPTYTGGTYFATTDSGVTWASYPEFDILFEEYGIASYPPSNMMIPGFTNATISLAWTAAANRGVIIRNATGYPATHYLGTEIYNNTGTSYIDIGLLPSHKYYYRAWNWNGTAFSANYSSINATTRPNPPYNVHWISAGSNINISWLKGTGSMRTVLRLSNTSQPILPQDGIEIYNGTNIFKVQAMPRAFFVTLFSFNITTGLFSSPGTNLSIYYIYIRCYNESSGLPITGYGVFFTNPLGTQTYAHDNCTNPFIVNTTVIPLGNDISFIVNATGYYSRTYVMDIVITGNYYINAYLVPITATLYYLRVVETIDTSYTTYDQAVEDVNVIVKRYINATVGYEAVSSLITDANGYVNLQLVPYVNYKIFLNKSGYEDKVSNYAPAPPNAFGQTVETVFRIVKILGIVENITTFSDAYDFYATMYTNNTINIICQELIASTTDAQFYIYATYNTSVTLFSSYSYSGTLNANIWVSGINTSRMYVVLLNVNHSLAGYSIQTLHVLPITSNETKTNGTWLENKIASHFGTFELGYVNTIFLFLPAIILIVLFGAAHQSGLGLFLSGCYIGGALKFMQFDIGTVAKMVMLSGLFIVLGILLIIAKRSGWYE